MEQTQAQPDSAPNISIPGFNRLYNQGWKMKLVWVVAILCCIGLCLYQIGDRITFYLKSPVKTKLNITRLHTVWFPAATICPGLLYDHIRRVDHKSSPNDTVYKQSMSADDVWEHFRVPKDSIAASVPCWTSTRDDDCDDDMLVDYELQKQYVDTTWGRCVTLESAHPLEYHGPFTRIILKLHYDPDYNPNNESISNGSVNKHRFTVMLHNKDSPIRHDAFFQAEHISKFHDITIRFTAREFNFLDRKHYPCLETDEAKYCHDGCIDKMLEHNLPCRLPFMGSNSNLKKCLNWNDTKSAYYTTLQIYSDLKASDCVCTKTCQDIVYNTRLDDKGYNSMNFTTITLYYSDNLYEIVSEIYVYPIAALLSDIGGNMGLFLGACALTWMEVLETLIKQLWVLRKGVRKIYCADAQQVSN